MKRVVAYIVFVSLFAATIVMATTLNTKEITDSIEQLRIAYEVDADSLFTHLDKMEESAVKSNDIVKKSIYYSYIACIYQDYYQNNRFFIDDRTDIEGPAPDDRNEWSKRNFYDTVRHYVELSVKERDVLLKAYISDYRELISAGADSVLRPTMYDILMHKAVEIMSYDTAFVSDAYQQLIDAHKDEPLVRDAVKLDFAAHRHNFDNNQYVSGFAEQYKGSDLYVYAKALEIENNIKNLKERHQACEAIINEFPDNHYINSVKSIMYEVERKFISISNHDGSSSTLLYPGKDETFTITYANTDSVKIEIFRVNLTVSEFAKTGLDSLKEKHLKLVSSEIVTLPAFDDFEQHTTPYVMKNSECGIYLMKISDCRYPEELNSKVSFSVTRFMACARVTPKGAGEIYVVDRLSGEPQKGVTIHCRNNKGKQTSIKSGDYGIAVIPDDFGRWIYYTLESGKDTYYPGRGLSCYVQDNDDVTHYNVSLFLDRGVYRPGQKVMAKGILYTQKGNNYTLATDKEITISLKDANGTEINSQKVTTNAYGSFYTEFEIPTGLLSGNFSLYTQYGGKSFKVEEYKRPTFEVSVDSVKANTVFDPIMVKGNSRYYRGVGVEEAKVSYTVSSAPVYFCNWILPQIKSHVGSGEAVCDHDGNFSFTFTPDIAVENTHPFYRLIITVNVTDASGETQSTTHTLMIGETSFSLAFPVSGLTDRDKLTDTAPKAYDTAGNLITLSGKYVITSVENEKIAAGDFKTGENIDLSRIESGKYDIKLTAKDDKGRQIDYKSTFTLYSVKDKKPAEESLLWLVPVKTQCDSGENAEFVLGSSFDSHILMEVYDQQVLVERSIVDINSRCGHFKVKYKPSFSDRLYVKFLAVKNGKTEAKELTLSRNQKPRNLKLELTHIKQIYAPGDKDKWSVRITDADGNHVTAELLASMYDLSLDAVCGNQWSFDPVQIYYKQPDGWNFRWYTSNIYCGDDYSERGTSWYSFSYPTLNMFGFDIFYSRYYTYGMRQGLGVMEKSMAVNSMMADVTVDVIEIKEDKAVVEQEQGSDIRSNFAETAFFYPQIDAENGSAEIEFTAPEALTSWKIMLLAHNKELRTAFLTDTIITQKTLSVNTNLPRFVRTSDSLSIAATIDNLSESTVVTDVRWNIIDALTNEVVASSSSNVDINAGAQGVTKCNVKVPMTASLLKVTVTAKGGDYTDGVEALIPVLSSQTLVTESMPISIYKEGDFTYKFESMANNRSETLINRGYSISVTPDAMTLALQSLPYVGEPQYENAVDYTVAYYVNWLSDKAVSENKQLAAYLRRVKDGVQDVNSPLEANQELKNILLQESPWVMDAKFETERNRSLVELLDGKAQEGRREQWLRKLLKLQNSDGGFSWFPEGKSSSYITLFVVEQFNKTCSSRSEFKKALKYLVSEMENGYNSILKHKGKPAASVFDMKVMMLAGKLSNESSEYYYKQVKKDWKSYTLPEQAVIARLFHTYGDTAEAKKVIDNIRGFSVFKPTLGKYWPNTSNIYTQSEYIKAFAAVDPDAEELAKMKMWLLFNKQANMWGNSVATADAIDALILAGNAVEQADNHIVVKVGNVTIDSDSAQWAASIDYNFPQSEVDKSLADVSVSKSGNALTLGAAYWQYTEDVDKVQKHTDSRLSLKKEYYVEKDGVLKPVDINGGVKVGDIVTVRLVVTADREISFVHLRDLRPAGLEPAQQVSRRFIMSGLIYYMCTKDCSTDLFFDYMPKGTFVIEYKLKANGAGDFAAGFATIESMYSNDFKSQTDGSRMVINEK